MSANKQNQGNYEYAETKKRQRWHLCFASASEISKETRIGNDKLEFRCERKRGEKLQEIWEKWIMS